MIDNKSQIQEAQNIPSRLNAKHTHLCISYSNFKKQIQRKSLIKPEAKKHLTYKEIRIRIIVDFLSETMQVQRKLNI